MELFLEILRYVLEILSYSLISFVIAWYFYVYKRKALPGRMIGSWIVGFIGAIIVTLFSSPWFIPLINWFMSPRIGDNFVIRVNLITAFIGAFIFLWLFNYVNHDKERRE
jgi:uncharacterized membrane protein YeaQ/YmgE (transglycosylase-associated protein family)